MGYYINTNSKDEVLESQHKAQQLIDDGAQVTDATFKENLVCVIQNGLFDAAGYCYSENEFEQFNDSRDNRQKTWLIVKNAAKLSGYDRN